MFILSAFFLDDNNQQHGIEILFSAIISTKTMSQEYFDMKKMTKQVWQEKCQEKYDKKDVTRKMSDERYDEKDQKENVTRKIS